VVCRPYDASKIFRSFTTAFALPGKGSDPFFNTRRANPVQRENSNPTARFATPLDTTSTQALHNEQFSSSVEMFIVERTA
jgi:hypothetical protein